MSKRRRQRGDGTVYYKKNKKKWYAELTIGWKEDGRRILKSVSANTEKEAEKKLKELRQQYGTIQDAEVNNTPSLGLEEIITTVEKILEAKGLVDNQAVPNTPTCTLTLGKFLADWLENVCKSQVRKSTYVRYDSDMRRYVIPSLGHIKLTDLTPEHIEYLYAKELDRGLSSTTLRHVHIVLRKAINYAVTKKNYIQQNIVDLVDKPKADEHEVKIWTSDEVSRFLRAARGDRYFPFYLTAVTTGLRQGELIGLRWRDINLDRGVLSVQRTVNHVKNDWVVGPPKSRSGRRTVVLFPIAITTLEQHKKQQEKEFVNCKLVFTDTDGGYVRAENMRNRSFNPLIRKVKIPKIRFHDLRHTHASLMIKSDMHPKVLQERLGHSTITQTMDTYGHLFPGLQEEVIQNSSAFDNLESLIESTVVTQHTI